MNMTKAQDSSAYISFSLAHNPSIALIQEHVRRVVGEQADYQDPATYHITAVYVTDISDEALQQVLEWTKDDRWLIPSEQHAFTITASRLGVFENGDERALYIAVDPAPELLAEQAALYDRFVEAGYQSALSPYSSPANYKPHITLAYLKPGAPVPQVDFELTCEVQALVFGRTDYEVFGVTHAKAQEVNPMPDKIDQKIALLKQINNAYAELDKLEGDVPEADDKPAPPERGKMLWKPSQEEVNYTPLSPDQAQLCGGCRWFNGNNRFAEGPACHLIDDWPLDIVATGHCDRWEAIPNPEPEPMPVTIVEGEQKSLRQRLVDTFKNFTTRDQIGTGFKVEGNHWVATWSNNFEDRDGEIFPAKAIDDYVWRVDMGIVPPPDLQVWHLGEPTTIGKADWVGREGHFLIAAGEFGAEEPAQAAKDFYTKNAHKTALSHGFTFDAGRFDGRHYHQFNTFEITLLPMGKEANRYTTLDGVKAMKLTDEKVQYLKQVFGPERATAILGDLEKKGKALEELGAEYKDFLAAAGEETEAIKEAAEHADKTFTEIVPMLMEGQTEAITAAAGALKAVNKLMGQMEAQNKQIDELRAELALSPRASQADETVIDADKELQEQLQKKEEGSVGFNPFPGVNRGQ